MITNLKECLMKDMVDMVYLFARMLRWKITKTSLRKLLLSHPDFPSLAALSDVFSFLRVANRSVRIGSAGLGKIALPAIAYVKDRQFAIIVMIKDDSIHYINERGRKEIVTMDGFDAHWSGVIFMTRPGSAVREDHYISNRMNESLGRLKLPFVYFIFILAVFSGGWLVWRSQQPLFLYFIALAGSVLGMLLVAKEWKTRGMTPKLWCPVTAYTDCDSVLDSPASRLLGPVKLSHVVFVFFVAEGLAYTLSCMIGNAASMLWMLRIAAVASVPVTLFSLYQQAFVIRKFCIYCLAVTGLLWGQLFLLLPGAPPLHPPFPGIGSIGLLFLTAGLGASLLIISEQAADIRRMLRADSLNYKGIKTNKDVIAALLNAGQAIRVERLPGEVVVGSTECKFLITMVINLECPGCSEILRQAEMLLLRHPGRTGLLIRYAADLENETSRTTQAASRLLKLGNRLSPWEYQHSLRDWYAMQDAGAWALKYPVGDDDGVSPLLKDQNRWIGEKKIRQTPCVIINDRIKPDEVEFNDLDVLIKTELYV